MPTGGNTTRIAQLGPYRQSVEHCRSVRVKEGSVLIGGLVDGVIQEVDRLCSGEHVAKTDDDQQHGARDER